MRHHVATHVKREHALGRVINHIILRFQRQQSTLYCEGDGGLPAVYAELFTSAGKIVESVREIGERSVRESRYYVSSLRVPAEQMGALVRNAHAPANFTTIKHMALNLLRRAKDKLSIRARRKAAAWDDDCPVGLISG